MINSIQSTPVVAATPAAAAIAVPTKAATIPTRSVSQSGIFCLPGATTRPRTPMISPTTNAVMMPVTSTMDLRQSQPAEQACVNSPNIDFPPERVEQTTRTTPENGPRQLTGQCL